MNMHQPFVNFLHFTHEWPRDKKKDLNELQSMPLYKIPRKLKIKYDLKTGKAIDVFEVRTSESHSTSRTSMSLQRKSGPTCEAVRGSVQNMPFIPGGVQIDENPGLKSVALDFDNLLTVPPGFKEGMKFESTALTKVIETESKLQPEDEKRRTTEMERKKITEEKSESMDDLSHHLIPVQFAKTKSTVWAEVVDANLPVDFENLVPNPAFTWNFELDSFQKQAIVKLENNESVFIAAHTSAGKTVVAEYAIALSQRHMRKTFYTSPIKALSNQKFRDFRNTFQDVGILTGDVQINPKASCLIMTTEILRSMLYMGSDSIRDLEWVIFDEVHYINDSERGVVWEEVLILLPDHVGIVMLSATVPNTLEFASWVGMTKKRKMYVISTPKRPVPLEHYLYTGPSGKFKEHKFLILGAKGTLLQKGYLDAVESKKPKEKIIQPQTEGKGRGSRGGGRDQRGGGRGNNQRGRGSGGSQGTRATAVTPHTPSWGPQQEKNIWIGVVNHLLSEDKLPIVAFTLSRSRCDSNAEMLSSVDLTTAKEKSAITQFLHKCLDKLKGPDKRLPQVIQMSNLLKRGIGIHHSGILPILKEIVEMLFQDGKVKLLFATETFAMGVNMPARSVVFDDIRKHDGTCRRTLLPAEYIQMAGRAGRRGLDSTGTVLILCKTSVPDLTDLQNMMTGKPQKLESQFRVTYSMILNLLRVKTFRIEDMMKRSFGELHSRSKIKEIEKELKKLENRVENLPRLDCDTCSDVEGFYKTARQYLEMKDEVYNVVFTHPQMVKELTPGRVLIVVDDECIPKLGLLLEVDSRPKERTFKTLVLRKTRSQPKSPSKKMDKTSNAENFRCKMIALAKGNEYSIPDCQLGEVLALKAGDVMDVTYANLKADCKATLKDWETRQIPRFRDDPPSSSFVQAIEALLQISQYPDFGTFNLAEDLKLKTLDITLRCQRLQQLRLKLNEYQCRFCPSFDEHLNFTLSNMEVRENYDHLKYLTSDESLSNLPEYTSKLEVLKSLGYVSSDNAVKLKGQVACSIGNHELMLTELIFQNVLTDLQEEDIAALLSCLVFSQRTEYTPELTHSQKENIASVQKIARLIGQTQQECGLKEAIGDYVDQFQFGLVEVVHKWAMGVVS
ncbi:hypothetical protein QYM36_011738 [Artemia franciscana]|uniref:Helicase SKI2W n=1 Tax=Artemia franciscana TaxID=6661 RepID=A0AA88L1M7_ARTSF|nr:hypothetical protein QYM36_011738 [Artemia franciscana]